MVITVVMCCCREDTSINKLLMELLEVESLFGCWSKSLLIHGKSKSSIN